jgi:hypothetical protein
MTAEQEFDRPDRHHEGRRRGTNGSEFRTTYCPWLSAPDQGAVEPKPTGRRSWAHQRHRLHAPLRCGDTAAHANASAAPDYDELCVAPPRWLLNWLLNRHLITRLLQLSAPDNTDS